jgi:hypothetical protein
MMRARVEHWLAMRTPARPDALAARMSGMIGELPAPVVRNDTLTEALAGLGVAALARVAQRPEADPGLALDLLAADAFVTYAFEAAAEEGIAIEPLVRHIVSEAA